MQWMELQLQWIEQELQLHQECNATLLIVSAVPHPKLLWPTAATWQRKSYCCQWEVGRKREIRFRGHIYQEIQQTHTNAKSHCQGLIFIAFHKARASFNLLSPLPGGNLLAILTPHLYMLTMSPNVPQMLLSVLNDVTQCHKCPPTICNCVATMSQQRDNPHHWPTVSEPMS